MNLKLFYSPPKWRAFPVPEKPDEENCEARLNDECNVRFTCCMSEYEYALEEAKANALEVGNEEGIMQKFYGSTSTLSDGVEFDWPGSAVIKDGKYILSV